MSQTGLELGHLLTFAQPGRDLAELRAWTRADDDAFALTVAHHRAHERARRQIRQRTVGRNRSRRLACR